VNESETDEEELAELILNLQGPDKRLTSELNIPFVRNLLISHGIIVRYYKQVTMYRRWTWQQFWFTRVPYTPSSNYNEL